MIAEAKPGTVRIARDERIDVDISEDVLQRRIRAKLQCRNIGDRQTLGPAHQRSVTVDDERSSGLLVDQFLPEAAWIVARPGEIRIVKACDHGEWHGAPEEGIQGGDARGARGWCGNARVKELGRNERRAPPGERNQAADDRVERAALGLEIVDHSLVAEAAEVERDAWPHTPFLAVADAPLQPGEDVALEAVTLAVNAGDAQ